MIVLKVVKTFFFLLVSLNTGLILNAQHSRSQVFKPLEAFKFESPHEYTLVIIPTRTSQEDSIIFFTKKREVLKQYQNAWGFDKEAVTYPFSCNDGYSISLIKGGIEAASFAIKLRCQAFIADNYYWHTEPMKKILFLSLMERAYKVHKRYEDIEEARQDLEAVKKNEKTILISGPEWEVHDGYFFFNVPNPNVSGRAPHTEWEKITREVEEKLHKAYPNQPLDISLVSYGYGKNYPELGFKVHCSKSFFKSFDMYPVSSWGWREFDPQLDFWLSR